MRQETIGGDQVQACASRDQGRHGVGLPEGPPDGPPVRFLRRAHPHAPTSPFRRAMVVNERGERALRGMPASVRASYECVAVTLEFRVEFGDSGFGSLCALSGASGGVGVSERELSATERGEGGCALWWGGIDRRQAEVNKA